MPSGLADRYDFFLSRRGSVAAIAQEVADVLMEQGHKVCVQDYDFKYGASFIEEMHEAIKNSLNLVILFTRDYEQSPYTRKEFTSFEAQRLRSPKERHIVILRCEDTPLEGLLADNAYQNLVGIADPGERKRRIIAAADCRSRAAAAPPVPPLRRCAAAHPNLYRPHRGTRPARRCSDARHACSSDAGSGTCGSAGNGWYWQDIARS
jgi:hypothetical protein